MKSQEEMKRTGLTIRANPITLTKEQINFYDDNGYLIVPGVYSEEACEQIKAVAEEIADDDYSVVLNIHRKVDLFLDLMRDPILVSMIEAVQRHRCVGLNSQFLYKKAGTAYAKQSWNPHQDNAYARAKNGTYLQLHIFCDASDPENGGLYYYPGSHKEDILPYEYVSSWKEGFDEKRISHPGWKVVPPTKYKKVDVIGPKGGVCLQHGNIIHGSYPNLANYRSRMQYSMAFLNEGVEFKLKGQTSVKIPVALRD